MTVQQIFDYVRARTNTNAQLASNTNLFLYMNGRHEQLWLMLGQAHEDFGGEIATTDLVTDQQEYQEPDDCLKIKRLEGKLDGTTWYLITPFDVNEDVGATDSTHVSENYTIDNAKFDVHDESVFLFPIPTVDVDEGLKMFYIRRPQYISSLTVSPGLPKEFHPYLVDLMCIDIEQSRGRLSVVEAETQVERLMDAFLDKVQPRNQGEKVRLKLRYKNYH